MGQFFGDGFGAGIVEAHAVHDGPGGDSAEHAGRRVARLCVPRNAAEFAEPEAKFFPSGNGGGKFIHAGGQADGVGKFQAEGVNRQDRRAVYFPNQVAGELTAAGAAQKFERAIMRVFRVLPE